MILKKTFSVALAALLLIGCSSSSADTEPTETAADEITVTVTEDRAGNPLELPESVDAIISMAPSTTQVLIDMGLEEKLIAVDTYSMMYYGDSLNSDIPTFDMMEPDVEQIIALEPDVVFTTGMSGSEAYTAVSDAGIAVAEIPSSSSIQAIEEDLAFIGAVVGESDKAQELISAMNTAISAVQLVGDTITDKKTVLFLLSTPYDGVLYIAGGDTFIDEMITIVGAENVAHDMDAWAAISEEDAVALNPDVICTNVDYVEDAVGDILNNPSWASVTAVVNNDVYLIDANSSSQPNNHIIQALAEIASAVYPDSYE